MKLKNTLGLHICTMIGTVAAFPVIELRTETSTYPWKLMLKVIVGGWDIHSIILERFENSSGMLALKHLPAGGWYGSGRLPELEDVSYWKGRDLQLNLTSMCKPRPHQLPILANIGSIGHLSGGLRRGDFTTFGALDRSVFIAAETPPSKSEFLNGQGYMKRLAELTAKFEFKNIESGQNLSKYYFAGDEYTRLGK